MKRKILAVLLSVGMTASIFCNTVAVSADDTTSVQQVTVASEQTTEGSDTEAEQTTTDTTDAVVEQTTTDTTDAEAEQTTTNTTDAEDEQTTTDATEADQTKTETTDTEVEQTTTETTDTEAEQTTNETTDTEAEQTTTETTDAEAEQISALSVSSNSADDTTVETEHKWGNPQWTWSDDYSSATLTLTCQYDSSHTKTVDATVTSRVIRPAFCFQDGKTTYTAKAEVDGSIWVDQKSDNAVKGSHKWGDPQWTWSDDYSSATLTLTCQYDSSHTKTVDATVTSRVIRPAFCFQDGKTTYTAKAEVDGSTWVDLKSDNAVKGSHKWGDPQWTWSDDYTSATVTRVCKYDSSHTETADAEITSEVTTAPTCTEDGVITYTATAVLDGEEITTQTTAAAEALGHAWTDPQWTWSDDYSKASVTLTCGNDETHTETLDAVVTKETTDSKNVYTASVQVDGVVLTDVKTVKIETSDTDKSEDTKDNDNNSSESETTDTKAEKEETSATAATTTKFNTTTSTAAATNTTTSTEAPETGDTANAAGWTVMIAGALLALVVLKKAKRYIK
jgi:hypothetical protein